MKGSVQIAVAVAAAVVLGGAQPSLGADSKSSVDAIRHSASWTARPTRQSRVCARVRSRAPSESKMNWSSRTCRVDDCRGAAKTLPAPSRQPLHRRPIIHRRSIVTRARVCLRQARRAPAHARDRGGCLFATRSGGGRPSSR